MKTNWSSLFSLHLFSLFFLLVSIQSGFAEQEDIPEFVEKAKQAQSELADSIEQFIPSFVFVQGGSGVLISEEGHFLTNYHVIAQIFNQDRKQDKPVDRVINIERVGGTSHKALVVGADPGGDLALGKIVDSNKTFPHIEIGNSDKVDIGQNVIALGNPFLRGQFSARPITTFGMISARHVYKRSYPDAIQTDAPINPGNSGGPLITLDGKLIGINGRIETKFGTRANSGVGYAISASRIRRFLPLLKKGGIVFHSSSKPLLQLLSDEERFSAEEGTIVVQNISETSAPYKAGFRKGDKLLSIDGYSVTTPQRVVGIIQSFPAIERHPIRVKYLRDGEKKQMKLERGRIGDWTNDQLLETLPTSEDAPYLGVALEKKNNHLVISNVVENSPAEQAGIQAGDLVLKINDRSVPTPEAAIRMIQSRWFGETVSLSLKRNGKKRTVEASLERRPEN